MPTQLPTGWAPPAGLLSGHGPTLSAAASRPPLPPPDGFEGWDPLMALSQLQQTVDSAGTPVPTTPLTGNCCVPLVGDFMHILHRTRMCSMADGHKRRYQCSAVHQAHAAPDCTL